MDGLYERNSNAINNPVYRTFKPQENKNNFMSSFNSHRFLFNSQYAYA